LGIGPEHIFPTVSYLAFGMVQAKSGHAVTGIHNETKIFIKTKQVNYVIECLSKFRCIQRWIILFPLAEIYQRLILTQTMVQIARTPALTGDLHTLFIGV